MARTTRAVSLIEDTKAIENETLKAQLVEAQALMGEMSLRLEEGISGLDLMIDNIGWTEISGYSEEGPTLTEIHNSSKQIRNLTALNAHMKRGLTLRQSYILEGGIKHDGIPAGGSQGVKNVQRIVDDPVNQKNFFSDAARKKREGCFYTNGQAIYIGTDSTRSEPKRITSLPVWNISSHYANPDDPAEVWAIRRTWESFDRDGSSTTKNEWIFLDEHIDKRKGVPQINYNGQPEPVAQNKRAFVATVNQQEGWAWGLPDALAAMQWSKVYRNAIIDGTKMQEALATLAYKLKAQTSKGASTAAAKVADATPKGGTAAMPEGMDIASMATAGRGYDFNSLRPVLAIMATGLEISVVALSSDPGAAGSSYGSAQTLDSPTRLAMTARRMVHVDLEKRVLKWLGADDARVWLDSLDDGTELYRAVQSVLLKWNSGLYTPQEIKKELEALFGHEAIPTIPQGVLLPNNVKSLARKDIDADGSSPASTVPAPNQGQADGVGGGGNSTGNDIRTDQIT